VLDALRENNFDVDHYLDNGALLITHTRDAHLLEEYFGENKMLDFWTLSLNQARQAGFDTLRAAVEMTWALSELPGCELLAPYETRLNRFTDSNPVVVLCQYNRTKFSPEKIKAIIHAHPIVVVKDQFLQNTQFVPSQAFEEDNIVHDIDAIIENLRLIRRLEEANRANQSQKLQCVGLYNEIENLASLLSRELQPAMGMIESQLRLLAVRYHEKLGPDADEFIEKSVEASNKASRMVDDLWNYAHIGFPGHSDVEEVDANAILKGVLDFMEPQIEHSGALIQYDTLPTFPIVKSHFIYLFTALIDNAIRYAGGKRPVLHISAAKSAHNELTFCVVDNGKGIDTMYSQDVFKPFQRIDGKIDENSTGMGLTICKRIMDHYGGRIWFEPAAPVGSIFYFSLPSVGAIDDTAFSDTLTDTPLHVPHYNFSDERSKAG